MLVDAHCVTARHRTADMEFRMTVTSIRPGPDISVMDAGSLIGLTCRTERAQAFLEENCAAEPYQWMGAAVPFLTLYVEPRYAADIIAGAVDSGLAVR
jgi:hypothetical protein